MMNQKFQGSKYRYVYNDIMQKIINGDYAYGQYLPPERDLSLFYNVQRPTVRQALDLLEGEGLIERRQGAGNRVLYVGTRTFGEVKEMPRGGLVAYIVPKELSHNADPFHMEICTILEELCKKDSVSLIFTTVSPYEQLPLFLQNKSTTMGIIWVSIQDKVCPDIAKKLGIPSVSISSDYPHFPTIRYADFDAAFIATQHLITAGCKRFAFISGDPAFDVSKDRQSGFTQALQMAGIPIDDNLIMQGDWTFNSGEVQTRLLLESERTFDCILGCNDMMALGALRTLHQAGVSVPSEVRVIGIDNIQASQMSSPTLSTVSISKRDVACAAYMMLRELMQNREVPDEIWIPGRLITRDST